MKASRYNIFITSDQGTSLLFNSASAALAEISKDDLASVDEVLAHPNSPKTASEQEFYETLCEGQFLIPDEIDELAGLTVRNRRQRFGGKTLFLTVAPTLACNFRCDYCFENPQGSKMSVETENALLEFADRHAAGAEKLLVSWFGGEPTLCVDTIQRLQTGFQRLSERHGLEMLATGLITNGYTLDRAMALRLKALNIADIQVTLDGPRRIHDTRRKLAGGGGTFDRIVSNLREIAGILRVTIRVNVDQGNAEAALELAQELYRYDILPQANLYFAPVNKSAAACSDLCDRCFTTQEFSATQIRLYERLASVGKTSVEYPMLAPGGHCGADSENAFVVAPSGNLFKCWEEISLDQSHSIGSVFEANQTAKLESNLNAYLEWDPLRLSDCRECRVLPICMGGCPRQGISLKEGSKGACSSWKYNLEEMLRLHHYSTKREEVTK